MDGDLNSTVDGAISLGQMVLGAGGLGIAAYGVVDGLKVFRRVALCGYEYVPGQLGPVMKAVRRAYGHNTDELLEAQYIGGRGEGDLLVTLRQGYRIGLPMLNEDEVLEAAKAVGIGDPAEMWGIARKLASGGTPNETERDVLARFEVAVDARIAAGLALAENTYVAWVKIYAGFVALAVALVVGLLLLIANGDWWLLGKAILIGVVAVPIAPVAKDLATAISEAATALSAR